MGYVGQTGRSYLELAIETEGPLIVAPTVAGNPYTASPRSLESHGLFKHPKNFERSVLPHGVLSFGERFPAAAEKNSRNRMRAERIAQITVLVTTRPSSGPAMIG